jgi:hypothetical protein
MSRLVCSALSLSLLSSAAVAQSSWREHLDVSRIAARRDSFVLLARGNANGFDRMSVEADGKAWRLSDEISLNGLGSQKSTIRFSHTLVEEALRQEGKFGTMDMRITLDRGNGRFTGSALTPTGGPNPVAMDVPVTDDVIDDNAVVQVLPFIKWREGLSVTIPVFTSGKGTVVSQVATVTGRGTTQVPAGAFDTWRLAVSENGRTWLTAEVSTTAPYRVVRMGQGGGGMDLQLAK